MLRLKKVVLLGCERPHFYGAAYRDEKSFAVIAYPIPLNIIMAVLKQIKFWFTHGPLYWGK